MDMLANKGIQVTAFYSKSKTAKTRATHRRT